MRHSAPDGKTRDRKSFSCLHKPLKMTATPSDCCLLTFVGPAFSMISPIKLIGKTSHPGLEEHTLQMENEQTYQIDSRTSSILLNTAVPQATLLLLQWTQDRSEKASQPLQDYYSGENSYREKIITIHSGPSKYNSTDYLIVSVSCFVHIQHNGFDRAAVEKYTHTLTGDRWPMCLTGSSR